MSDSSDKPVSVLFAAIHACVPSEQKLRDVQRILMQVRARARARARIRSLQKTIVLASKSEGFAFIRSLHSRAYSFVFAYFGSSPLIRRWLYCKKQLFLDRASHGRTVASCSRTSRPPA